MNLRSAIIRRRRRGLFSVVTVMLEHQFAYLARIGDRTCFRSLKIAASHRFKKSAVNLNPEVPLQVVVGLCYIEGAR